MLIGVDFDNTIVCYDALFRALAVERGLVPVSTPPSKGAVRDYLRQVGREDAWTELQGYTYGPRMREAQPFPGALQFFRRCRERSVPVCIVSHRTRFPYLGEQYDLHLSARQWLEDQGFHDPASIGLPRDRVFLEISKQDKCARITALGCSHFIDDLPELLADSAFPAGVTQFLFDPNAQHAECGRAQRVDSWATLERLLTPQES